MKVSWAGLLDNEECADGMIVKWWRSSVSSIYYNISDKLPANKTEFIVKDLFKDEEYIYQVRGAQFSALRESSDPGYSV